MSSGMDELHWLLEHAFRRSQPWPLAAFFIYITRIRTALSRAPRVRGTGCEVGATSPGRLHGHADAASYISSAVILQSPQDPMRRNALSGV
jgi:hypothetical protein